VITDRQWSGQADTGHPLLCGKLYELFLVCLQDCGDWRPMIGGKGWWGAALSLSFTL